MYNSIFVLLQGRDMFKNNLIQRFHELLYVPIQLDLDLTLQPPSLPQLNHYVMVITEPNNLNKLC